MEQWDISKMRGTENDNFLQLQVTGMSLIVTAMYKTEMDIKVMNSMAVPCRPSYS